MPKRLRDEVEECKNEIKKLSYDNEKLRNDLFILDTKGSLKQTDFMEYKSIIIGRMYELMRFVLLYNKKMDDIKKTFILIHGMNLVYDVYKRHPFSFLDEIKMFVKIADCINDILVSRKDYNTLWNHNHKLYKIYNLVQDNLLKFECVYNIIYSCYKLGYTYKCKEMIGYVKNLVNLNELGEECEINLQRLKNKIYE